MATADFSEDDPLPWNHRGLEADGVAEETLGKVAAIVPWIRDHTRQLAGFQKGVLYAVMVTQRIVAMRHKFSLHPKIRKYSHKPMASHIVVGGHSHKL